VTANVSKTTRSLSQCPLDSICARSRSSPENRRAAESFWNALQELAMLRVIFMSWMFWISSVLVVFFEDALVFVAEL